MSTVEQTNNTGNAKRLCEAINNLKEQDVKSYMLQKVQEAVYWGDEAVKKLFSGKTYPDCLTTDILTQFSILYITSSIQKSGNKKFSSMVSLKDDVLKNWLQEHKLEIIEGLMENFLFTLSETKDYVRNYSKFMTELAGEISDSVFVNMSLIKMLESQQSNLRLLFWCVRALDHSTEKEPHYTYFNRMVENLQNAAKNTDISVIWKETTWLDEYLSKALPFEDDIKRVASRLNCVESSKIIEEKCLGADPSYTSPITLNYRQKIEEQVGKSVAEWMVGTEGPKKYGWCSAESAPDCSRTYTKDVKKQVSAKDVGGCVAKGTRIQLANGTEVPIEEICPGQRVLSRDGMISVTSDELVVTPGLQLLYSVNDQPPFLSQEQAYLTPDGYAALEPNLANEINSFYHVRRIQVGDIVYRLQMVDGKAVQIPERVERINVWQGEGQEVTGYDLHFREGTPSYFANGYLCLLNYPEITVKRLKDRIAALPAQRRQEVLTVLEREKEVLKDCLGAFAANAIERMMKEEGND